MDRNESQHKSRFEGVIFDLDGTLLNTIEDLADSVNAALVRADLPDRPLDYYYTAVGDGAETMVWRCLPEELRSEGLLARVHAYTREEYARRWNHKTKPYDGIPDMLDSLSKAGMRIAILSNKPHASTLKVVAEFLPHWDFAPVRGAREDVPIKPDPQAALDIADHCGIAPEKWIYVGDTDTDMQTARAARFFAVGVSWGFRSIEELREHGADMIADHPADISEMALNRNPREGAVSKVL